MTPRADGTASGRLGVDAAPGGLRLVQDLLNTRSIESFDVPDLLADETSANTWLGRVLDAWSLSTGGPRPVLTLAAQDLATLREGRTRTRGWLAQEGTELRPATVVLRSSGARLFPEPHEGGADGLLGLVAAELLLAVRDGSVSRLKTCANPACGTAFYDLSRNGSRVWHDVRTCGNVANLRASRARRRAAETGPHDADHG